MYFDGSMMITGTGARVIIISPRGFKMRYVLQIHLSISNNVAEYKALFHSLRIAIDLRVRRLIYHVDFDFCVQ